MSVTGRTIIFIFCLIMNSVELGYDDCNLIGCEVRWMVTFECPLTKEGGGFAAVEACNHKEVRL